MMDDRFYRPSEANPYLEAEAREAEDQAAASASDGGAEASGRPADPDRTTVAAPAPETAVLADTASDPDRTVAAPGGWNTYEPEPATVARPFVQASSEPQVERTTVRPPVQTDPRYAAASAPDPYAAQSRTQRSPYAQPTPRQNYASGSGIHTSAPYAGSSRQVRDPEAARIAHDAQLAAGYGYTADDSVPDDRRRPSRGRKGRDQVRAGDAAAAGHRPISARRLKFWRWFRAWPIVIMILLGIAAFLLNTSLGTYAMRLFYPVKYAETIAQAAEKYGVDQYLVAAIAKTESGWKADAVSSVGAQGLMQIMPDTADFLVDTGYVDESVWPPSNLLDAATNIQYGCAYVSYLEKTTGSTEETIAAYNAGPGVAAQWAASPQAFTDAISYPETRLYVARVTNALSEYRTLYPGGLVDYGVV
jgi:soluble lytic murein transglycosylase